MKIQNQVAKYINISLPSRYSSRAELIFSSVSAAIDNFSLTSSDVSFVVPVDKKQTV